MAACGAESQNMSGNTSEKKPNVLFIAIDDLNTWLGCLNGYSNTPKPHIDRLDAQGFLFSNAPLLFVAPDLPKGKVIDAPAEMLSIYPTLLDLCGLPPYERNEGKSLLPEMLQATSTAEAYAITTFGMHNHAVRSDHFRYIQYEDGGE